MPAVANQMIYCRRCVMPSTKPDLQMDSEGICSACRHFERRKEVDWSVRKKELLMILEKYRSKNGSNYDCIIPASGGKDSTFQVLTILELGFNPLCVTASTDMLSEIGRYNIENLKMRGVDCVEISTNPVVRKKINRLALTQVGDLIWPEHVTIFTIPVRIAVQLNVPLLIWGENSQNEYGGPAANAGSPILDRRWLEEFGGLLGLRVSDLPGRGDGIEQKHLIQYTYPTDEELKRVGVTGLFLGHYVPWDGHRNAEIAQQHGMKLFHKGIEGQWRNYENLDNVLMGIHDYFKFLKFGFGRATDLVCMAIRRERLTREEGVEIVKTYDGAFPWTYLDVPLSAMLDHVGITQQEFLRICDQFTNKKIFKLDVSGKLLKDKTERPIPINDTYA